MTNAELSYYTRVPDEFARLNTRLEFINNNIKELSKQMADLTKALEEIAKKG